ncbi:MAG TPA: sigma-54 dependent transcriptional regulator [Planctomycetota bacterium]|nr:sigma-54 dependent transcriptional regulator [Planctomycetota bacterium]
MTSERNVTGTETTSASGSPEVLREPQRPSGTGEVLVVNRDPELRVVLGKTLYAGNLSATTVATEAETIASLRRGSFDMVLIGIDSPESIDLLARMRNEFPLIPVVAIARTATPDLVRDILRSGARDFLFGSLDTRTLLPRLLALLPARAKGEDDRDAGDRPKSASAAAPPAVEVKEVPQDYGLLCSSRSMLRVLEIAETVAPTDSTVLIQGESGTGKELIAKRIHRLSKRNDKPFVEVNCGALPENLLESQLFGHEKGSFTGAVHRQLGLFELADQGSIFLDEIGEMSLDMQVKLLRVLQAHEFRRIGGSQVVKVDVRVIAATNKDLKAAVEQNLFRSDLYYRLNVIALEIPPLRDRAEEIPALVESFSARFARERSVLQKNFTSEAVEKMQRLRWTGNVRELENAVERLLLLSKKDAVEASDLDEHFSNDAEAEVASPFAPTLTLDAVKKIHIDNVLRANEGNKMRTARILKINVKTLYNLMKKLEIKE